MSESYFPKHAGPVPPAVTPNETEMEALMRKLKAAMASTANAEMQANLKAIEATR